jgi:hypothetical protein
MQTVRRWELYGMKRTLEAQMGGSSWFFFSRYVLVLPDMI